MVVYLLLMIEPVFDCFLLSVVVVLLVCVYQMCGSKYSKYRIKAPTPQNKALPRTASIMIKDANPIIAARPLSNSAELLNGPNFSSLAEPPLMRGMRDAALMSTNVKAIRVGSWDSCCITDEPLENSAPNAATTPSIARRLLIISGAPLKAMSSDNWGALSWENPEEGAALPTVPLATACFHSASV